MNAVVVRLSAGPADAVGLIQRWACEGGHPASTPSIEGPSYLPNDGRSPCSDMTDETSEKTTKEEHTCRQEVERRRTHRKGDTEHRKRGKGHDNWRMGHNTMLSLDEKRYIGH